MKPRTLSRILPLLLLMPLVTGCLVAAAAAGAGAGVYLSDRGASSLVEGSLAVVDARTRSALDRMGVTVTETTLAEDGSRKVFRGVTHEVDVVVELESRGGSTHVSATARRSPVEWDRGFARALVQRIVEER